MHIHLCADKLFLLRSDASGLRALLVFLISDEAGSTGIINTYLRKVVEKVHHLLLRHEHARALQPLLAAAIQCQIVWNTCSHTLICRTGR